MSEPLYKIIGKKSSKVEAVSAVMLSYEAEKPAYGEAIVRLVDDTIEVGIEIEMENVSHHNCTLYAAWQPHNDGSLRNNGMEYVTVPIKGKRIHYCLNQFFDVMGTGIRFTPRTSIHVHMNVLDMTLEQIAGLLIAYLPFEKLLYRYVGGSRDKSNFCVPLAESGFNTILDLFLNKNEKTPFQLPNLQNHRYMGINVDAIRKFGSLEFRHLGGTNDKAKIVRWINLIFSLKKYAMGRSFEEIKNKICRLNTDSQYMAFVDDVFGPVSWYLDTTNLQQDMEGAVSLVKGMTVQNVFRDELRKKAGSDNTWYKRLTAKEKSNSILFGKPATVRRRAVRIPDWDEGLPERARGLVIGRRDRPGRPEPRAAQLNIEEDRVDFQAMGLGDIEENPAPGAVPPAPPILGDWYR